VSQLLERIIEGIDPLKAGCDSRSLRRAQEAGLAQACKFQG